MLPIDLSICPCCTGTMLYLLAQSSSDFLNSPSFLQLGKSSLAMAIGFANKSSQIAEQESNSG